MLVIYVGNYGLEMLKILEKYNLMFKSSHFNID